MSSIPILGYWNLRGRAQSIRYLLKYAGVQFLDKRYPIGEGWPQEKNSLGLDFPNLPYYIDGDIKLSQTLTILRYLSRKHDLVAKDEPTLIRQELAEQQILTMAENFLPAVGKKDWEQRKDKYISETLVPQLNLFNKFLGSKDWLTPKLSYVDFMAYETLDWFRLFSPESLVKFPTLEQYLTRFESLDRIKQYRSSPEYKDWPLFNAWAKWGYSK